MVRLCDSTSQAKSNEPSDPDERSRFLSANLTKVELVRLLAKEGGRREWTRSELVEKVLVLNNWDNLLEFILSVKKLEWWQTLFLQCLLNGPKNSKEIMEDSLVTSILAQVKAEGLESDPVRFRVRKFRLLVKYRFVTRKRSGHRWNYAISDQIAKQAFTELSGVTKETVLERFHASLDYRFIQRYKKSTKVSMSSVSSYMQPTKEHVGSGPPTFIDEGADIRRIVAFSDYRVQDIGLLLDFVGGLNPKPDVMLYGGDDVSRFGPFPSDVLRMELQETYCPPWNIRWAESGAAVFNLNKKFESAESAVVALAKVLEEDLTAQQTIKGLILSALKGAKSRRTASKNLERSLERTGFKISVRRVTEDPTLAYYSIKRDHLSWLVTAGADEEGIPFCYIRSEWSSLIRDSQDKDTESLPEIVSFLTANQTVLIGDGKESKKALLYNPTQHENLFQEFAKKSKYGICAVIGNDDYESVNQIIRGMKVFNVHKSPLILGDYAIIGMEGSPTSPEEPGIGICLYRENSIKKHLDSFLRHTLGKQLIVVSHTPPRGVLDHAVRFGRRDIGSKALREFVEGNESIKLVLCGHVHRCGGMTSRLAGAYVVNAASHDNYGEPGRVAIIDIDLSGEMNVKWHFMHELSGIFGVGDKTLQKLHSVDITKVEDLLKMETTGIHEATGLPLSTLERFAKHARAIMEDRPVVLSPFEKPEGPMVYLDIETNLDQSLVWLVGIYSESRDLFKSFFARTESEEEKILTELTGFLDAEPSSSIGFYACTGFDKRVLESRLSANGLPTELCDRMLDLCLPIRRAVALPLKSYGIKSLAQYFGYEYRHPELDGFGVALQYMNEYLNSHDQALEQRLLEYNKDDVMFLKHLLDKVSVLAR